MCTLHQIIPFCKEILRFREERYMIFGQCDTPKKKRNGTTKVRIQHRYMDTHR